MLDELSVEDREAEWRDGLRGEEPGAALVAEGFGDASLWVIDTNGPARRFYEVLGWRTDGVTRHDSLEGVMLDQVRYRRTLTRPGAD